MSVYDTFTQSQGSKGNSAGQTPQAEPQATAPVQEPTAPSVFSQIESSLSGMFGGKQSAPTPQAPAAVKSDKAPAPIKSVYDSFKATQPAETEPTPPSVYDSFKANQAGPAAKDTSSVESPYFYAKDASGATIGASDEKDTSGKPFLGYRNPGDTATTTDKTRIATTFDPRKAAPVKSEDFLTPRAVADRAALKQSMGGTYNDELDHVIALELAGSNDPSNLQIEPNVPGTKNTATDPIENSLAKDVISGKKSLFQAQTELAKAKGKTAPWTPPQPKSDLTLGSILEKGVNKLGDALAPGKSLLGDFLQELPRTAFDKFYPGIREIVTQLHDDPETALNLSWSDVAKSIPEAGIETAKSFFASPVLTIAGGILFPFLKDNGAITVHIPGIGDISNLQANAAEKIKNGAPVWSTILDSTPDAIFSALMVAGMADKVFGERHVTIAKGTAPEGITVAQGPKSFDLYNPPISTKPIPTDVLQKISEQQGFSLSKDFDPKSPTYFRMTGDATTGKVTGEIVQIKPSYFQKFMSAFKGDASQVPDTQVVPLFSRSIHLNDISNVVQNASDYVKSIPNKQGGFIALGGKETPAPAESKPAPYAGETDLTTKVLQRLEGRTNVSKQFIQDLTNAADLKQPEKDLIRKTLDQYPDGADVPVAAFANAVKTDILPLERSTTADVENTGEGSAETKYENVSLPSESRGPVANYTEHVYESPIKTSAGDIHFDTEMNPNYFAHTRIEDLAAEGAKDVDPENGTYTNEKGETSDQIPVGTTRRVIELQSDLFQKGRLESEFKPSEFMRTDLTKADRPGKLVKGFSQERNGQTYFVEPKAVEQLGAYRNTWHERVIREEVKQAAKDGKTTLLFPTGDTAMKIEGLGETNSFRAMDESGAMHDLIKPEGLRVGRLIGDRAGHPWVVTRVIGDGKFEAVPKREWDKFATPETSALGSALSETFDIKGKDMTDDPIYKFYEKEVARYLKNNYKATPFTDAQGVTWNKVDVKPEEAKKPVTAFKKGGPKSGYMKPVEEVRAAMHKAMESGGIAKPEKAAQLLFSKEYLEKYASGTYQRSINPRLAPIIKIFEEHGKGNVLAGIHEAGHLVLDPANGLISASEKNSLLAQAKKDLSPLEKAKYFMNGYRGKKVFEEKLVDEWAKKESEKQGYKGRWKNILEMFSNIIKRLVNAAKNAWNTIDKMLPKEGRQGGYIRFGGKKSEVPPLDEDEAAAFEMNVINQEHSMELSSLEKKGSELEVRKEAIDNNPAKQLVKYAKDGKLPTVTGGPEAKGKFAKRSDDIVTELGFKSPEAAQTALDKYRDAKEKYEADVREFKSDKAILYKKFIADAEKYNGATTHPTGRYDAEITEANGGVVPPVVRGNIKAPEMDMTKLKDIAALRLGRDTMERNLEKVAGPYADELKDFLIEPVRKNEVDRVKFMNETRAEVRAKVKEWGIKRRSRDSSLVQLLGEGKVTLDEVKKQSKNWKNIESASDYFRKMYDHMLDKLNEERGKFWYAPIPKHAEYFRHFNDINEWTKQFGFLRNDSNLPTSIAGMSSTFKPGKPFSTTELQRTGNLTSYDAIGGMDNYLESISKQMYHIDSTQRGRALEKYIRSVAKQNPRTVLPNFVQNVQEWSNLVSGKAAMIDRSIESTVGRPIMKAMKTISNLVGKNIVVGNVSVAMTHLVSLPLNLATVDKVPFTRGLLGTLVSPLKAEPITHVDGVESSFLTRRFPEKYILPTNFQKAEETLAWVFKVTDMFKSKLTVSSKYYEGLSKGKTKTEAMAEADKYAGRIIGDYSTGNRPNLMSAHVTALLAQFQLGVNDSMSVLVHDIPQWEQKNKWKITSRLVAFAIFSYLFNIIYKKIRGAGKGIDPIDAALTIAGMNDEGAGQDFISRLSMAGKDVAGELPFSSLAAGTFPLKTAIFDPLYNMATNNDRLGAAESLASNVISPIGGGAQAKKTIEGIQAVNAGETNTGSGQRKTAVEQTPLNYVKGAIFGKSALNAENGQSTETNRLMGLVGAKNGSVTKDAESEYARMKALPPTEAAKAFDDLTQSNPSLAKRVEQIATEEKTGITQNERLIKMLNVSLGVRAKYIYDKLMALPDDKARAALWDDYTTKKIISPQVSDQLMKLMKK